MINALIGDLNLKRLTLCILAVFGFIFVSDFVIHGLLLKEAYMNTAHLWRTEEDMHAHMIAMLLGQLAFAKGLSVIFAKGYENKGLMEGVRFGILVLPLVVAPCFVEYAVTPMPLTLLAAWVVLGSIQAILGCVVAAMVYKKR